MKGANVEEFARGLSWSDCGDGVPAWHDYDFDPWFGLDGSPWGMQ